MTTTKKKTDRYSFLQLIEYNFDTPLEPLYCKKTYTDTTSESFMNYTITNNIVNIYGITLFGNNATTTGRLTKKFTATYPITLSSVIGFNISRFDYEVNPTFDVMMQPTAQKANICVYLDTNSRVDSWNAVVWHVIGTL